MIARGQQSGRTLFVVNPAAGNGTGAEAANWLRAQAAREGIEELARVVETACAGHAAQIAHEAEGFAAVVVVGGDGTLHEVAQGLMARPRETRPMLGLLPFGNGNDWARTVCMPRTDIEDAWGALKQARPHRFDVGRCNGELFLQTLSFGLDAAIALGTQERRLRTGLRGTRLFLEEGFDQLHNHLDAFACRMELGDSLTLEERMHLLAVQVGRTYGGGFAVCPDASPEDGLFDVCLCRAPLGFLRATTLFLLAKGGHHARFRSVFLFERSDRVRLSFDREPPVQIDGERMRGKDFMIETVPGALDVLCGPEYGMRAR